MEKYSEMYFSKTFSGFDMICGSFYPTSSAIDIYRNIKFSAILSYRWSKSYTWLLQFLEIELLFKYLDIENTHRSNGTESEQILPKKWRKMEYFCGFGTYFLKKVTLDHYNSFLILFLIFSVYCNSYSKIWIGLAL